jgi:hypothetical protein
MTKTIQSSGIRDRSEILPKGGKHLCLDHDHATGKFRGILCFHCNTVLGKVKDSTETLQNMISYLNRA